MIDDPSEYRYVIGADIDNDHPHGDMDRVKFDGDLMPFRTGNLNCEDCSGNPIPKKNIMRGEDIAFLAEAGVERGLLAAVDNPPLDYSGNAIGPSNKIPFTRRVSLNQAFKVLSLCSGMNERVEWLDPAATITPQIFSPNTLPCPTSSWDSIQSVAGISPRHTTSTVNPSQLFNDRYVVRRAPIEAAFAAVASRMRCVDTYGGALVDPGIGAEGYFYGSWYIVQGDAQYDGGRITGYTLRTTRDIVQNAVGSCWSMPVRSVHLGMGCELYALIMLEYENVQGYSWLDNPPAGSPAEDSSSSSGYIMALVKFTQQESPISTVQTIDAFGAWLGSYTAAMMNALGLSRWTDNARPSPPSGSVARSYRQTINAHVVRVYPVFTITHTNLQRSQGSP